METTKTVKRRTRLYNPILLPLVSAVFLIAVFFLIASSLPQPGPVRGKIQRGYERPAGSVTLVFERGWNLTRFAERHYGQVNPTILDMILGANPEIKDINRIPVNQKIVMPPLVGESFVMRAPDSRYTVHLGTFNHIPVMEGLKQGLARDGKTVEIIVRNISPGERWYRVEAGPFPTREEGIKMLSALKSKGISFESTR